MLFVERSNRTERLLAGMAARLMVPGQDPLSPSIVVVQGPGMERFLAQSIARRYGVCANTEFVFPRQFLDKIFGGLPGEAATGPNPDWAVGRLVWSIARCLSDGRGHPDYAPLARHLEAADGDWRLVQLSQQIAVLFDRYITYRPDWIREWSEARQLPEDRDARWQARLIRELGATLSRGHLADRAQDFLAAAQSADSRELSRSFDRSMPGVVEIFAISTLPPLYLAVIDALARFREVHLSVLSPSRSYWADLWREVRDGDLETSVDADGQGTLGLFDAAPVTPAARLLASLGRLGGDFQRCLEDQVSASEGEDDQFESPIENEKAPHLLARLQADLLDFDGAMAAEEFDRVVSRSDDSIQVHLCHGPRRELEVVESVLRDAFERDPTLSPEDVIVMAPRIDEIAPEIEAIFGVPDDEARRIPFRIADRGVFQRSRVADAFRGLLDLLGGRAARTEVLDWLTREPARMRFGLEEEAVERLGEWSERAGIRFGLDEVHREELGLVRNRAHTWADGLERLALAHAVGAGAEVYAGSAPEPLDPFAAPDVLGAMGDVETMLREAQDQSRSKRSVASWCAWLSDLLERSCARVDENTHEHAAIRRLLRDFAESARATGFEEPIPLEAIRERVAEALASNPAPQAFLAGGVTFCELVPLRAIPFRVVVILGMSDQAFPRGGPAAGFDLMARAPRAGDRNTRSDDRYLFLEALMSARDRLILTVPGRDVRDGSDLPPSIVVTELLDAIEEAFEIESASETTLRETIVVEHALQAFSPRYFESPGDPRMRGRDAEAYAGAKARREAIEEGGGSPRLFLGDLESVPADPLEEVDSKRMTLDLLSERILQSTRYFVRERLGMRLPRTEEVAGDLDPVGLEPLEQFALGNALLADLETGYSADVALARLHSRSSIPAGLPGALSVRALHEEVAEVAELARGRCRGERRADLEAEIDLEVRGLGVCQLRGRLDRLWPDARVQVAFGRIAGRSELDVWIRHLFLCACVEEGAALEATSVLVGRGDRKGSTERIVSFGRVPDPHVQLARLFEWAWSVDTAPLPFFPKASRSFALQWAAGKIDEAWRDAEQTYRGGNTAGFRVPESEQGLEHARLWEGASPIDRGRTLCLPFGFDKLAEEFFGPYFDAREVHVE